MSAIVIHAGMPKTGSSSIQEWLGSRGEWLRAEAGVTAVRLTVDAGGEVRLGLADPNARMNSGQVVRYAREHPPERERVADEFRDRLDRAASSHRSIVVSSEAFHWLWRR